MSPFRWCVITSVGICCFVLLGSQSACDSGSQGVRARYTVTIAEDTTRTFNVVADYELPDSPDTLLLGSLIQYEAFPFDVVGAWSNGDSASYSVETTHHRAINRVLEFRAVKVVAKGRHLTLQYRGEIGIADGDPHAIGYSGKHFGMKKDSWAVFSLSQILLLPFPTGTIGSIEIKYDLPANWRIASADRRIHRDPARVKGALLKEALLSAIVVGQFNEIRNGAITLVTIGDEGAATERQFDRIVQDVENMLGHKTTPYLLAAVPVQAGGFEVFVEPTDFAGVVSNSPIGFIDRRRVAELLIRHSLGNAQRPFVKAPADRWFSVGSASYLSQALDTASNYTSYDRYLEAGGMDQVFTVAEKDYDSEVNPLTRLAFEEKSAAIVQSLDWYARTKLGATEGIVGFLRDVDTPIADLRGAMRDYFDSDFSTFFDRYVFGTEALAIDSVLLTRDSPTSLGSDFAARAIVDSVLLLISYDGNGFLETCGCKVSQAGGIARRATAIKKQKREFPGATFAISLGNEFPANMRDVVLQGLASEELSLYMSGLAQCQYDCIITGEQDLLYGTRKFREFSQKANTPFVASNAFEAGEALGLPSCLITNDDVTARVMGITRRSHHWYFERFWLARNPATEIREPHARIAHLLDEQTAATDLTIVGGSISPRLARSIANELAARRISGAVILSPMPMCRCVDDSGKLHSADREGFVGGSIVLYPRLSQYGLSKYVLYRNANHQVVDYRLAEIMLTEDIPDDLEVRRALDNFYSSTARLGDGGHAAPTSQLWRKQVDEGRRYVGSHRCASCHAPQHKQWLSTPHSSAFNTLLSNHRQYNGECVSCHVTGFGQSSGYEFAHASDAMKNVECEACHGPGSAHATTTSRLEIVREPVMADCATCHDSEHSEMSASNFVAYLDKVRH